VIGGRDWGRRQRLPGAGVIGSCRFGSGIGDRSLPGQPRGSGAFACEIRIGIGNGIPGAGESELALRGGVARGRSGGRRALVDPEAPQDGAHGGGVGDDGEDLSVVSAVGAHRMASMAKTRWRSAAQA